MSKQGEPFITNQYMYMAYQKLVIAIILCFVQIPLYAQADNSKCAPNVMKWLKSNSVSTTPKNKVITYKINDEEYLGAFIKVNNNLDESEIRRLGVLIRTKAGNIWTVDIPQKGMQAFIDVKGIEYIELDYVVKPVTDSARYVTGVDSVHAGINLPFPISGKGVIVGVVDVGYDYTHPAY